MPRFLTNSSQRPRFRRPNPFDPGAAALTVWIPFEEGLPPSEWMTGDPAASVQSNVTFEPSGRGDWCAVFDGSTTWIDFPSTPQNQIAPSDVSVLCWVYFNNTSEQICMEKGSDVAGQANVDYGFGLDASSHLAFIHKNTFVASSGTTPSANAWH